MWSIITHFNAFTAGTVAGVVLLWLMQAGKMADEGYENMERRNNVPNAGAFGTVRGRDSGIYQ